MRRAVLEAAEEHLGELAEYVRPRHPLLQRDRRQLPLRLRRRGAPEVIDAEITYADGTPDTLTGTPNHPFWVDAVRDYVPLGELEVGTLLHVQGGGEAILVSKTWRQGDFEVFDFEVYADRVDGLHNFYVRGEGSDAAGVLVHNSTASKGAFGSGKGQHTAEVIHERAGEVLSSKTIKSGNMTPDEKALGFPQSSLATHTEARAVRDTPLQAGDSLTIKGEYPPCPSCKGKMNKAADESGASVTYQWGDETWEAGK